MWVAWGNAAMAVLKVVVLLLLTRLLSPKDFGVVSAALVVITFSLNFSQLGLGPAVVQRPNLEPRHVSTGFVASTGFGLLLAVGIWLGAPLIAQFFRIDTLVPVVRWLAVIFVLAGISTVPEGLLQRELRFRVIANRDVVAYAVGYGGVGIVLALLGWGVWALVAAQLAQALIRTVILLRVSPPLLRARPTWQSFVELMGYGVGQSAARMAVILANQADNLVVGRWLGAVALGVYNRAYQLMAVPTSLIGDVMDRVLFPAMARVQDDPRRLGSAFLRGTALLVLATLPIGVVAAILAPEFVAVAFGKQWTALVPPFQVLALGMMFRTSWRLSDSLSRATGNVYRRALRQALYASLVFLAAWVGKAWGVTGVAIGVVGAIFANYVSMTHLSLGVLQTSWRRFVQAHLPAVWLTVIVGGVTMLAVTGTRHLHFHALAGLVVGSLAALGSAGVAVWLLPGLVLGEHGVYLQDMLRTHLWPRLVRLRQRGTA
jgi:PST family polysaccharide transporter